MIYFSLLLKDLVEISALPVKMNPASLLFILSAWSLLPLAGCAAISNAERQDYRGVQPVEIYVGLEVGQLNCHRVTDKILWHIGEMKRLAARERTTRDAPPKTLAVVIARRLGREGKMGTNIKLFQREHEIVTAMNAALKEGDCTPVDIDAHVGEDISLMAMLAEQ